MSSLRKRGHPHPARCEQEEALSKLAKCGNVGNDVNGWQPAHQKSFVVSCHCHIVCCCFETFFFRLDSPHPIPSNPVSLSCRFLVGLTASRWVLDPRLESLRPSWGLRMWRLLAPLGAQVFWRTVLASRLQGPPGSRATLAGSPRRVLLGNPPHPEIPTESPLWRAPRFETRGYVKLPVGGSARAGFPPWGAEIRRGRVGQSWGTLGFLQGSAIFC